MTMSLYETCTADEAVAAFSDHANVEYLCDRQFAVFPQATLCFATMGDPDTGTKLLAPSEVAWKPARLDYHPEVPEWSWLPRRLIECVERDGAWLPLHHMFLRPSGVDDFVYAGIAELRSIGDIPENGRVQKAALYTLDVKLPREMWLRFGGYQGRLVAVNGVEHRLPDTDVASLERLLVAALTTQKYVVVFIAGYEEHWFRALFNANRAWLMFLPGGERRFRAQKSDCTALESRDPDCLTPRRRARFGEGVVYAAARTVPRDAGVRAVIEHFCTGQQPECVQWREIKL